MTASLRSQSLSLVFPDGTEVGPLDLDLGPGVHHLQGANGSGKSSLLRCLCAEWRPSAGRVEVCGGDPHSSAAVRRDISLLDAEPELPDVLTVDEAWQQLAAIRGVPSWDGATVRGRLGIPGHLPLGHCSAGQRKRAELLAAAAGDPRVMLLDEVFANLDPESVAAVVSVVEDWRDERVLLVTSHLQLPLQADSVHRLAASRR